MRKTDTLGMEVAPQGMTFLIENMGKDCPPFQYIRELTQNSIEAIQRGGYPTGTLVWDLDQELFQKTGIYKLCITDTGVGMTGEEMKQYINSLSKSGGTQGFDRNFGIGAKIAAATRNKAGMVYSSWKEGAPGQMVVLWKDAISDRYGLKPLDENLPDLHVAPLTEIPSLIKEAGHGTKVTLFGKSDDENTMEHDGTTIASKNRWIAFYLNTRYFAFPKGITVKARESYSNKHTQLRTVTGMKVFLTEFSDDHGTVHLKNADVRWWVLSKDVHEKAGGHIIDSGHVAALFQNELYNMKRGKAGIAMLQQFGVAAAMKRVVLYVEPRGMGVTPNTPRTELLIHGNELPWDDFAEEFREKLPSAIRKLIEEEVAKLDKSQDSISILEKIRQLFDFPSFRRNKNGIGIMIGGLTAAFEGEGGCIPDPDPSDPPRTRLDAFIEASVKTDIKGKPSGSIDYPKVVWVNNPEDYGLTDRAASYSGGVHTIYVNERFRGFTSLVDFAVKEYRNDLTARTIAEAEMKKQYELSLMEAVLGILSIHRTSKKEWAADDVKKSLSPEALTTGVMQRYHQLNQLKRELTSKCGRPGSASGERVRTEPALTS